MDDLEYDEDECHPIVIDNGTFMIKAGFGGDDAPRSVFPNLVKRIKSPPGFNRLEAYVGDDCYLRRGTYNLCYSITNGIITSFIDMGKIWCHTFFNELCIVPEEHAVLLTEKVLNPKSTREQTAEIMFETFNVPSMYLAQSSALSLYASGTLTGVVLDSGSVTETVPIYEGYALKDYACTVDLGGKDITKYLMKLLNQRGYTFTTSFEKEVVVDIKEKLCYVSTDYEKDKHYYETACSPFGKNYELPDGQVITVDIEMIEATEILFKPFFCGKTIGGIHEYLLESIMKCPMHYIEICNNIVLSGGNVAFNGIENRLKNEMNKLLNVNDKSLIDGYLRNNYSSIFDIPLSKDISDLIYKLRPMLNVNVIKPLKCKYSTWIGGSIFSSLSSFEDLSVTKTEFQEYGKNIVNRKCF